MEGWWTRAQQRQGEGEQPSNRTHVSRAEGISFRLRVSHLTRVAFLTDVAPLRGAVSPMPPPKVSIQIKHSRFSMRCLPVKAASECGGGTICFGFAVREHQSLRRDAPYPPWKILVLHSANPQTPSHILAPHKELASVWKPNRTHNVVNL